MSKAFVNPREYAEASAAERELVKGRGGFRPRKKALTRKEHRENVIIDSPVLALVNGPSMGEANALSVVVEELARTKDRALPTDPLRRVALVVEEAGEALQVALDLTRSTVDGKMPAALREYSYAPREALRIELIQCASMAIRVLGAMDEEDRARTKNRPLIGPYRRRNTK